MQQVGQEDNTIVNLVRDVLDIRPNENMNQLEISTPSELGVEVSILSEESSYSAVGVISDSINQGQTMSRIIGVDSQSTVSFLLLWENGEIDLNLVDPDGNLITPNTTEPDVTYMRRPHLVAR